MLIPLIPIFLRYVILNFLQGPEEEMSVMYEKMKAESKSRQTNVRYFIYGINKCPRYFIVRLKWSEQLNKSNNLKCKIHAIARLYKLIFFQFDVDHKVRLETLHQIRNNMESHRCIPSLLILFKLPNLFTNFN